MSNSPAPAPGPSRSVRVIPRLDIKGPNLIKGICFDGQRALGLPEEFAALYCAEGADELFVYDTVASLLCRPTSVDTVARVADVVDIPLAVAGGLRSLHDIRTVLRAGADKVAINTAALHDPDILRQASDVFGAQCVVASIEYFTREGGRRLVWTEYGREEHAVELDAWIDTVISKGVGEIMLTAIDRDGRGIGADLDLVRRVARRVPVPVIVGGGIGSVADFVAAADAGADAIAAASVLHYAKSHPFGRRYLSWPHARLRVGAPIDSGNIDFVNEGYGAIRAVPVVPCTLLEVKSALAEAGLRTRHARAVGSA